MIAISRFQRTLNSCFRALPAVGAVLLIAAAGANAQAPAADPAPVQAGGQVPVGFVTEVIHLKYAEPRQAIDGLDAALNDSKPDIASPHPGRRLTIQDVLPQGTRVAPYAPSNSIVITTTPDGLKAFKQLLRPLDVKPQFILIEFTCLETSAKKLQELGLAAPGDASLTGEKVATTPGVSGGKLQTSSVNLTYLGNNISVDKIYAVASRVIARPRIVIPNGASGYIRSSTTRVMPRVFTGFGRPPAGTVGTRAPRGYRYDVRPRLNRDGTVTIDANLRDLDAEGVSTPAMTSPGPGAHIPGLRIVNGDTVAFARISRQGGDPGKTGKDRPVIVYLIRPNLIDNHGQIVPGGAEAVRQVMEAQDREEGLDLRE